VSPEGKVVYAHYNENSADNPDTAELLRVVRSL